MANHQQRSCRTAMASRRSSTAFTFKAISAIILVLALLFIVQPITAQDTSGSTGAGSTGDGSTDGSTDQTGNTGNNATDTSSTTTDAAATSSTPAASSTAATSSTSSTSASATGPVPTLTDSIFNRVGYPCQSNQSLLLTASNQLMTDCGYLAWCNPSTNLCDSRGCRKDEWPFGYSTVERSHWPHLCNETHFCPDEGSYCMEKIPLGGACQLDRDDECHTSAGQTVRCLHNTCTAVNATLNNPCIHDNVVYTVFTPANASYGSIISRDNCISGLYCNSPTGVCLQRKDLAVSCSADKECMSDYCQDPGYTAQTPDNNNSTGSCAQRPYVTANAHQIWVYPVIIVVALVVMGILIITLLKVHQSQGTRRRERARQYWESQRVVNEKARLLKEDVRMSQPGTPRFRNGTFDSNSGSASGSRVRSYGAAGDGGKGLMDESQRLLKADSVNEGPSRHASYDGAYAQSSGHNYMTEFNPSEQRHSKSLPRQAGETYTDDMDDSILNTTIAGMHGHQHEAAGSKRMSHNIYSPLSDNDNHSAHSSASLIDSPRFSEPFLTPSQSQTRFSLMAAHDHSVLESESTANIHDAARMYSPPENSHPRRTSAQLAGVRNRESIARYAQAGSPDARRTDAGYEWSYNQK